MVSYKHGYYCFQPDFRASFWWHGGLTLKGKFDDVTFRYLEQSVAFRALN